MREIEEGFDSVGNYFNRFNYSSLIDEVNTNWLIFFKNSEICLKYRFDGIFPFYFYVNSKKHSISKNASLGNERIFEVLKILHENYSIHPMQIKEFFTSHYKKELQEIEEEDQAMTKAIEYFSSLDLFSLKENPESTKEQIIIHSNKMHKLFYTAFLTISDLNEDMLHNTWERKGYGIYHSWDFALPLYCARCEISVIDVLHDFQARFHNKLASMKVAHDDPREVPYRDILSIANWFSDTMGREFDLDFELLFTPNHFMHHTLEWQVEAALYDKDLQLNQINHLIENYQVRRTKDQIYFDRLDAFKDCPVYFAESKEDVAYEGDDSDSACIALLQSIHSEKMFPNLAHISFAKVIEIPNEELIYIRLNVSMARKIFSIHISDQFLYESFIQFERLPVVKNWIWQIEKNWL